jgi:trehalose 6-phosphate phosphatase
MAAGERKIMQYLFEEWADFSRSFKESRHVLLLSDFDGTIAVGAGRPEDTELSNDIRQKFQALAGKPQITAGVISGRSLAELKSLVAIKDIYYSGNHGLEIESPGLNYVYPHAEASRSMMKKLGAQLEEALKDIHGVIIQEKGFSISVHYRMARPEDEDAITGAVKRITAPQSAKGEISVYPMKKIWEIRSPVDWHKGSAIEFIGCKIKAELKISRLMTIYLGDDTTDEDAFKALSRPDGWSIFIGGNTKVSSAVYYLNSVAEVEQLLDRLIKLT